MDFINLKKRFLYKKIIFISLFTFLVIFIPFFVLAQDEFGIVPDCRPGQVCNFCDLIKLINNIIDFIVYILAIPLATIMFAYAGYLYITDIGSGSNLTKAKSVFTNVAWGLLFILAAWLIIETIFSFLTGKSIDDFSFECAERPAFQTPPPAPEIIIEEPAPEPPCVPTPPPADCGSTQASGGSGTTVRTIDVGSGVGDVTLNYDAFNVPDQFKVEWNGQTVIDTGSISSSGSRTFNKTSSSPNTITVTVIGASSGTSWNFSIDCPPQEQLQSDSCSTQQQTTQPQPQSSQPQTSPRAQSPQSQLPAGCYQTAGECSSAATRQGKRFCAPRSGGSWCVE